MPSRLEIALDGHSAGSACLAMAIISTLRLRVCVCRCALYCMPEGKLFETREQLRAVKKTALPKVLRKA